MTHRRDKIEKFCRSFLHGNGNQQLHEHIGNYEREFSQLSEKVYSKVCARQDYHIKVDYKYIKQDYHIKVDYKYIKKD